MKVLEKLKSVAGYSRLLGCLSDDARLNGMHVSLFSGLFVHWQRSGFTSPFAVTRRGLMGCSKIASIATYHKCMRELDGFGYIRYVPSYHPRLGSLVHWPAGWEVIIDGRCPSA